jgi:hypothetical protein
MAIDNLSVFSRLVFNLPYIISIVVLYLLGIAAYRLYFSPIAHVPGPKLAALSRLYEFYHDCINFGQFYFHIQELHKQYGMIDTLIFFHPIKIAYTL